MMPKRKKEGEKMKTVEKEMFEYVNRQLDKIEEEHGIEILYCVEAGSRGWGFSNEDSDYDVTTSMEIWTLSVGTSERHSTCIGKAIPT